LYSELIYNINFQTILGDVHRAKWILHGFMQANNELTEILNNLKYVIWSKKEVFKRNTANDRNKRFYSHSLRVNT